MKRPFILTTVKRDKFYIEPISTTSHVKPFIPTKTKMSTSHRAKYAETFLDLPVYSFWKEANF